MNGWSRRLFAWAWLMGACGPAVPVGSSESSSANGSNGSDGTTTAPIPETTGSTPGTTPTPTPVTTGDGSLDDGGTTTDVQGSTDEGCGFICPTDPKGSFECSIWNEDCPSGEKCMPWVNDGGTWWNATKCVPIDADPGAVGEPCTVEGSGVSGIDSCELHAMCWDVDAETLEGTCEAFCVGSPADAFCEQPCSTCSLSSEGALNLCLQQCDPLGQDCPDGDGCYLTNDVFSCGPDVSKQRGGAGDSCDFVNDCDPGLDCASGEAVPDCEDLGCCTPFCAVDNPSACNALPGSVCMPLGLRDPGCFGEGVGLCSLP